VFQVSGIKVSVKNEMFNKLDHPCEIIWSHTTSAVEIDAPELQALVINFNFVTLKELSNFLPGTNVGKLDQIMTVY